MPSRENMYNSMIDERELDERGAKAMNMEVLDAVMVSEFMVIVNLL